MEWGFELWELFSAKTLEGKLSWFAGTVLPIAGFIYAVFAFFKGKWPFRRGNARQNDKENSGLQSSVQDITIRLPDNKPLTEGQIIGEILDLDDDAKSRVLETLNKIAGQPPEADETREEIAEAVEEARAGDLTDIRALLNSRYQKFAAEHGGVAKNLAEAARDLAAVEFPFNKGQALALYRQATELEPDDFWSWINLGHSARDCGDLNEAMNAFDSALKVAAANDDNREIAISETAIADIFLTLGNLGEGKQRYIAANKALNRRADAAPDDFERQRDLSVSHNNIGDVRVAEGDLPQALKAYQASLDIAKKLAAADPGNAGWQRDLSVSHEKIGDVRVAEGNLPQALQAYQATLDIAEKLAAADPGNAGWQRDLITSNVKLADTGDQPAKRLARALEIAQALRDTGRLNPADYWMIDNLKKRIADLPGD